jgi:hypothetical protein
MPVKARDIEDALMFTSDETYGNEVYLSKKTGEVYFISDLLDDDDIELPDDFYDSDDYISIPHKRDFDLDNRLAYRFAKEHLPDRYDKVVDIFHSRGAYARFKNLLEDSDKLQAWYDFENQETLKAIHKWCKSEGIECV